MAATAIVVLILSAMTATASNKGLYFRSLLQINYDCAVPLFMVNQDDAVYYGWLNLSTIFPQMELVGTFTIRNRSDDTLRLAPQNQSYLQYLKLQYAYRGENGIKMAFPVQLKEVGVSVYDSTTPSYGQGNSLPPHWFTDVNASCLWNDLGTLEPRVIEFQWVFDNSVAASQDSTITQAYYEGRIDTFKILLNPQNRLDSIYYFNMLAKKEFAAENMQATLSLCQQALRLDSLNFNALERITDTLWRLRRFNEAETYAHRDISILQNYLSSIVNHLGKSEVSYYLSNMQQRLHKIQQHEDWQAIGSPRQ